ncbi:MAG: hypothetical protein IIT98_02845 [Kiritimatiellae bacterium]|nr:hypothetical protein [Kiritimatiellia bacterium]
MKRAIAGFAAAMAFAAGAETLSEANLTTFDGATLGAFDASTFVENQLYFWRATPSKTGEIVDIGEGNLALQIDNEGVVKRYAAGTAAADGETSAVDVGDTGLEIKSSIVFNVCDEDIPDFDGDTKFAIWAGASGETTNLYIRAGKFVEGSLESETYTLSVPASFDYEAMHDIVAVASKSGDSLVFKFTIDGSEVADVNGVSEFPSLVQSQQISRIEFEGYGTIDNIGFAPVAPAGYTSPDGTIFELDAAGVAFLENLNLAPVDVAGTIGGTPVNYATAYALGLLDATTGELADELTPVIKIEGTTVTVELPHLEGYEVTVEFSVNSDIADAEGWRDADTETDFTTAGAAKKFYRAKPATIKITVPAGE